MSFSNAVADPVFRIYAIIVTSLLVACGLLLVTLSAVLKKKLGGVWATYRGWLVMGPLALVTVAAGRTVFISFVTLLSLAAFWEYARATGLVRDRLMTAIVCLGILILGALSWLEDPRSHELGWYGLFIASPVWLTAVVMTIPILRNNPDGQLRSVSLAILGFIYFGWMFGHLAFLANSQYVYGYVLFLLFASSVCDVAAFTLGKLIGGPKLRSRISPGKTWAGSIGAFTVGMLLPWVLGFSFPHFSTSAKLLTGVIIGVGGQLGDLTISFIKRDLDIKDMGSLIPGHGGILDRVDSVMYAAPLFFHMVRWFYGL